MCPPLDERGQESDLRSPVLECYHHLMDRTLSKTRCITDSAGVTVPHLAHAIGRMNARYWPRSAATPTAAARTARVSFVELATRLPLVHPGCQASAGGVRIGVFENLRQ
jgi:hypothetical protein